MALYRLRANIRYPKTSGLATWSRDQMQVRHQQAVYIKEGLLNEESPVNKVIADGVDYEIFKCDLPLHDKAAAADAFATLSDASVFGQAVDFENDGATSPSWIEHHVCRHDEAPQKPCEIVNKATS